MMAGKPSIVSMARGGMYGATVALPAYQQYKTFTAAGDTQADAASKVAKQMVGIHPTTGEFNFDLLKYHWGPLVIWSALDAGLSKLGVYRKMGRLMGNLNLFG